MPKEEVEAPVVVPAPKAPSTWPPVVATIVLMPLISFVMTQYVLIPHIQGSVAVQQQAKAAAVESKTPGDAKTDGKKDGKPGFSYKFDDIVVNLSGAMGTRYLKTTFSLFSSNPDLEKIITENKSQLLDVALNVLSSKSMADLEAPGSKNLVRNDLIANFNQALNSEVVEQIYFSEFVVQ